MSVDAPSSGRGSRPAGERERRPEQIPARLEALPLRLANLELWPDYQVFVDGERVGLTRREFDVLSAFATRAGQLLSKQLVHRLVWGTPQHHHRDRSVDVYVRKLAAAAPGWRYIHTHHGVGYRFEPQAPAP
jgi:DNA-binding response OmpR family regulator